MSTISLEQVKSDPAMILMKYKYGVKNVGNRNLLYLVLKTLSVLVCCKSFYTFALSSFVDRNCAPFSNNTGTFHHFEYAYPLLLCMTSELR